MKVAILDMGGANLNSIQNAVKRLGAEVYVTACTHDLNQADRLILPGVGHASYAMKQLSNLGLIDYIRQTRKKVLGICLGMQILYENLEEGEVTGLGLFPGRVSLLSELDHFRIPNIGWAQIDQPFEKKSELLKGISNDAFFYFTHSYFCPQGQELCAVTRDARSVSAIIEYKNFFATQFHPEKSGKAGSKLLHNFIFN